MTNQYYYGFVLGRNPAIGATEIYLRFKNEITELFAISSRLVIIGLQNKITDPESIIDKLYGTVKIIEIHTENDLIKKNNSSHLLDIGRFRELLSPEPRRITYGFSIYNINAPDALYKKVKTRMILTAYKTKKEFRTAGYNANFLGLKEDEVTTSTIKDKQMIQKGADFAIIIVNDQVIIGKTVAIQDTQDYEKRNYHRPVRNLQSGIMPIKLARSMIALSGASLNDLVVDPFCGSGTIITELILMGYTNIAGSDNDPEEVQSTKTNTKWLFENYPQLKNGKISWKIEVGDAKLINRQHKTESVKAIISEPYMGPVFKTSPSKETINQLFAYLSELYLEFFKSAHGCLKNNARIVFIFPVIPVNEQLMYLDILPEIKKVGFQPVMPLPKKWQGPYSHEITNRNSFLIKKEGQIMIRELFVFEKTG